MDTKIKEIVIDLDRSKYPNISHDLDELIQQEAIDKLKNHMDLVIEEYDDPNRKYLPEFNDCPADVNESCFIAFGHFRRRHDVIALLGERGTGKSNFLVNLKTILGEEHFSFLKIIDPTLFDDRQNILVAIIFMIQDVVEKGRKKEDNCTYEKWLLILSELAEGLNLVDDGIGNNPMRKDLWDDARLVMDRGLNVSRHGYTFERNFHKLLSYSLKLIGKKAIILRFDDIDTNPEKGWHVLEVIRKYLTTPHLQVIISGDLKLYSKIVRLKQWERLHKLQDYRDDENLKKTIDNLEEQYLSKILQPTNRISLGTLRDSEYSNEENYRILLKKKDRTGKIEKYMFPQEPTVKSVYTKIFSEIFNLSHNLLDSTNSLIMTLPIRTNLQVLRAYNESLSDDENPVLDKKIFMSKFTNVFLTLIDRFDFDYRDFNKLFEPSGYSFLANKMYTLSQKHFEVNFRNLMTPQVVFEDEDINLFLLFAYGFIGLSMNKSPNLIFDWYYRIHMLSVLILKFDTSDKLQKARMYLDYKNRVSTYKVAIKFSGLLLKNENKNGKNEYSGFASIYRDQKEAKNYYALNKLEDNIKGKIYTDSLEVKNFIQLLLSIATKEILVKRDKQTLSLVGIHYIFGFLANTLENDDALSLLKKMSYPNKIRDFKQGENTDSRISYGEKIYDSHILEQCDDKNSCEILNLARELNQWKQKIVDGKIDSFSIQQIDYLWQEFDLRESEIDYTDSAGKYLEIQIFLFLDLLMRAQLNYEQLISYKVIKNPNKARAMFLENVKKYYKAVDLKSFHNSTHDLNVIVDYVQNKDTLTLFDFFIICPLWNYYIHYSELKSIFKTQGELPLVTANNTTPLDLAKEDGYYSGVFKHLEIMTSSKVEAESSLRQKSIGKTDKEIIIDNLDLIDEQNLFKTIKSLMQKAKEPESVKRISKKKVEGWIEIYNNITGKEK